MYMDEIFLWSDAIEFVETVDFLISEQFA